MKVQNLALMFNSHCLAVNFSQSILLETSMTNVAIKWVNKGASKTKRLPAMIMNYS